MKNVEQTNCNGKTITIINLQGATPATLPNILNEAQTLITSAPPKSILSLTDATNFTFNKESAVLLKTYSEKIIPNIKASCVVGADSLRGVLLSSISQHIQKEIKNFGTRTEAINWLSTQ
jgi:hypothetical protein